jgi:hypothetical protein
MRLDSLSGKRTDLLVHEGFSGHPTRNPGLGDHIEHLDSFWGIAFVSGWIGSHFRPTLSKALAIDGVQQKACKLLRLASF